MTALRLKDIPRSFAVRPLRKGQTAKDRCTCGTCGLSWDDGISTSWTPAPSGRCPFEYFHKDEQERDEKRASTLRAIGRAWVQS